MSTQHAKQRTATTPPAATPAKQHTPSAPPAATPAPTILSRIRTFISEIFNAMFSYIISFLKSIFGLSGDDNEPAPVVETPAPVVETPTPVEETTTPAEETSNDGTTTPVEETTTPVGETTTPVEETSNDGTTEETTEKNVDTLGDDDANE